MTTTNEVWRKEERMLHEYKKLHSPNKNRPYFSKHYKKGCWNKIWYSKLQIKYFNILIFQFRY